MRHFTDNDLDTANKKFLGSVVYGKDLKVITDAFTQHRENSDKTIIAFKIALIDITNSTNISRYKSTISLNDLVDVICSIKDFDKRLSEGDLNLIKEIAECKGKINLFSFATKYCYYHNTVIYGRDDYSIYDTLLKNYLPKFKDNISKSKIEHWRKSQDYQSYHNCITEILDSNGITTENRRSKFDKLVWSVGKDEEAKKKQAKKQAKR